jgi:hypothetical protein
MAVTFSAVILGLTRTRVKGRKKGEGEGRAGEFGAEEGHFANFRSDVRQGISGTE